MYECEKCSLYLLAKYPQQHYTWEVCFIGNNWWSWVVVQLYSIYSYIAYIYMYLVVWNSYSHKKGGVPIEQSHWYWTKIVNLLIESATCMHMYTTSQILRFEWCTMFVNSCLDTHIHCTAMHQIRYEFSKGIWFNLSKSQILPSVWLPFDRFMRPWHLRMFYWLFSWTPLSLLLLSEDINPTLTIVNSIFSNISWHFPWDRAYIYRICYTWML